MKLRKNAKIINDVSGFDYDEKMIEVIKNSDVKIILQHSQGTPENMQINPKYDNVIDEIFKNLKDISKHITFTSKFTPNMDEKEAKKLITGWHDAVKRCLNKG